jgi:hypothetical protein
LSLIELEDADVTCISLPRSSNRYVPEREECGNIRRVRSIDQGRWEPVVLRKVEKSAELVAVTRR